MLRAIGCTLERLRPLWAGLALLPFVWSDGRYWPVGLAVLLVLWIWAGWASGIWLRRTPLAWPWLIWLAMAPITLWATAAPQLTRTALALFAAQVVAFWTLVTWTRSASRARWAWAGLAVAGVTLAGLAVLWLRGSTLPFAVPAVLRGASESRAMSLRMAVNENVLAGILVALWPLTLAWAGAPWPRRRWLLRLLGAGAAVGVLAVLALTQSRGAWIAAAGALFVLLVLRWRWLWLLAPLVVLALAVLVWQGRLNTMLTSATSADALSGLDGRLEVWSRALYAIQDFAFTGIGMGTFQSVIPLLYPYFLFGPDTTIPHAHNLWLQVAVDLGLPGLIAFVSMSLITVALADRSLRSLSHSAASELIWLQRGAVAGLCAALIHGLLDAVTWNTRPAFLVWALWGTAVAVALLAAEHEAGTAAHHPA